MVKIGSLFKSSFAFATINTTNRIIRFFSFLVIARFLGPEQFGTYSIVLATIEIFRAISDFGIDIILVRKISINSIRENDYVKQAFHLKFILTLFVLIIGYSIILIFYKDPIILRGVIILSLGSFFFSFSNTLKAKFQAKLIVDKIIVPTTVLNIFYLILIYLSTKTTNNIEVLFFLQALLDISTFIWLLKLSNINKLIQIFPLQSYLIFLKNIFPLALATGMIVIYSRITIYFLSFLSDDKFVGYYAASYRITESTMILISSLAASLLPLFSSLSDNNNKMLEIFLNYGRKVVILSILFFVVISSFANPIINILYSGKYNNAYTTLAILAFWIPFAAINMILTNLIISKGKQKYIPMITTIILFINIISNLFLVRLYQSQGAALSAVITEAVNFIIQISIVRILIKFKLKNLFPNITILFLGVIIILLIIFQGNIPLFIGVFLLVSLLLIFYFTGEINREKILELITK